jgi:hypothetical protein
MTHTEQCFYTVESKYSKQPAEHLPTIHRTKLMGSMDEECKIFKAKKCSNKENALIKKRSHVSIYSYCCKPVFRRRTEQITVIPDVGSMVCKPRKKVLKTGK